MAAKKLWCIRKQLIVLLVPLLLLPLLFTLPEKVRVLMRWLHFRGFNEGSMLLNQVGGVCVGGGDCFSYAFVCVFARYSLLVKQTLVSPPGTHSRGSGSEAGPV